MIPAFRLAPSALRPALLALALLAALLPPAPAQEKDARPLIAVLDLKVVGGAETEGVAISNALREELLKTGKYKLIDRGQMDAVLQEQALQQVTCSGAACVAQVGQVLGVAFIVTGSVTKISPELYQVSASLIDVQTAETRRAESVLHQGGLVNLLMQGMPALALKIAGNEIGAPAPPAQPVVAAVTPPAVAAPPPPPPAAAPAGPLPAGPLPAGPLRFAFVSKQSMPSKRKDLAAAESGGRIYVVGGRDGLGLLEDRADVYDPQTDGWTGAKRLSTARANAVALALGNSVYAIGGYNPLSGVTFGNVEVFDTKNQTWSAAPALPSPRGRAAGAVVQGRLYVIGGEGEKGLLNEVIVYDPATRAWGRTVDTPIKLSRHTATLIDGRIYVAGGYDGSKELNSLFVFDPLANTWTQKAPLRQARAFHAAATVAGKLYVFGGERNGDELNSVEEYDPSSNAWTERTNLPDAMSHLCAASVGGKIYIIGGDDGSFGSGASNTNLAFE